jgi:hypothetical protein
MTEPVTALQKFQTRLAAFRQRSSDMLHVVDQYPAELTEKSGACGWWSPKQVIAHEAGWLVELHRRYDLFDAGDTASVEYDFDDFNAKSVEARAALDWNATVSEFRALIERTLQRAEGLSPEQIAAARGYGGWLHGLDEDFELHTGQLVEFQSKG